MKTRNKIIYIPRLADLSPDCTLTAGGPDSASPRCSEPELRADAKMTLATAPQPSGCVRRCCPCGVHSSRSALEVHHRDYKRLGKAGEMADLICLCDRCHRRFHEKLPKEPA